MKSDIFPFVTTSHTDVQDWFVDALVYIGKQLSKDPNK